MIVRVNIVRSGKVEFNLSLIVVDGKHELNKIFSLIKSGNMLAVISKATFCVNMHQKIVLTFVSSLKDLAFDFLTIMTTVIRYGDEEGNNHYKDGTDQEDKYLSSKLQDVSKQHHKIPFPPNSTNCKECWLCCEMC